MQSATDWPTFWVQAATGIITLGALIVAIVGTYRATEQAKVSARQAARAQAYLERRDEEVTQREADELARDLAAKHAVFVYVKSQWTSIDRPWPQFSMSVTTDQDDAFYLQSVTTSAPLRANQVAEELVVYPVPGEEKGRLVSNGLPWGKGPVQAYLPEGLDLTRYPSSSRSRTPTITFGASTRPRT